MVEGFKLKPCLLKLLSSISQLLDQASRATLSKDYELIDIGENNVVLDDNDDDDDSDENYIDDDDSEERWHLLDQAECATLSKGDDAMIMMILMDCFMEKMIATNSYKYSPMPHGRD